MPSLLQNIRRHVGKAASEIVPPALFELEAEPVAEPTMGWVVEEDYTLVAPRAGPFNCRPLRVPSQAPQSLLPAPRLGSLFEVGPSGRRLFRPLQTPCQALQALPSLAPLGSVFEAGTARHIPATFAFQLSYPPEPRQTALPLLEAAKTSRCLLEVPALALGVFRLGLRFVEVESASVPAALWGIPTGLNQWSIPLLHQRETTELVETIQSSSVRNLMPPLMPRGEVSGDLGEPLTPVQEVQVQDSLAWLLPRVQVSEDLHKPLSRRARADGKRYLVEPDPQAEPSLPPFSKLEPPLGNRKAFEEMRIFGNRRITRGMSVWDLLFPLLQRPVNLDLGTVLDLPEPLWDHQSEGVEFLAERHAALLGDDMGTGKTVQTLVAMRVLFQAAKVRTALIVCPLSVVSNWDGELAKWAGNLGVTVVRGGKEHRKTCWRQSAHVWLTTYDTLRNDLEDVLTMRKGGFDLVVLDEAQRIKNWSAGVTRAVRDLRATYRWGLSGTPLENNVGELWTILNVLTQGQLDWSKGIQNVLRPMFLRRRKDVLNKLPPLIQNPVWLRLEDEQRKSYDRLEKEWVYELDAKRQKEEISIQHVLALLNKLKQVCNRCPRTGESSKLVWLRDSLDNIAATGAKALVFSQYTQELCGGADWLEKELAGFGALNYSKATSEAKRKTLLAAFKEKSEHKVFVGHPKTAGLGLNELVVANYVVHFDHWWNPAVMNQATARAHRPGQLAETVFAYDLWVQDTYERIIFDLLQEKQSQFDEVIDSLSTEREPSGNLAWAVADKLFAKYGLNSIKPRTAQ